MATKVTLTVTQLELNKHLSMEDSVQDELKSVAKKMHNHAEARLAAHRKSGDHKIVTSKERSTKYGHIDWVVSMEGTNAVAVEFGHWSPKKTNYVPGLYIITMAMVSARL